MKQECKLILPVANNNGNPTIKARLAIECELLAQFGGYTMTGCVGAWQDPKSGEVFKDAGIMYMVAAEWNDAEQYLAMRIIAKLAADLMEQESIYLCFPHGVEFVEPTAKPDNNAFAIAAE